MLEKFLSIQNEISKLLQNRFPPPLETGHSRGEIVQFMSKMHQPEYPAYEIKHNSYFTSV